jgi:hypothetical protein
MKFVIKSLMSAARAGGNQRHCSTGTTQAQAAFDTGPSVPYTMTARQVRHAARSVARPRTGGLATPSTVRR